MLVCPVCGFRNPHSNERCLKCSALLQRNEEIIHHAMYEGAAKARRQFRRDLIAVPLERLQRFFDFPSWRPREGISYRFPFTAGGLSILPGLGQFYNQQISKGLTFGAVWFAFLLICVFTIQQPFSNVLLVLLIAGWMLVWNDAVGTAIRTSGQTWSLRNSLALVFGALFLVGATLTTLQFVGLSIVSLIRVRQDVERPVIAQGDRVWVNHTRYWLSTPHNGDMVFFDPPRFTAEQGANVYSIDIKSYFQRVIGTQGDRVEKKGTHFYRNSYELPKSQWPLGADTMPDFSVSVPMGKVLVPVTRIPQDTLGNLLGGALSGGIATLNHVGESGFVWPNWQDAMMVPFKEVYGKAVAVVDPPEHRQWL